MSARRRVAPAVLGLAVLALAACSAAGPAPSATVRADVPAGVAADGAGSSGLPGSAEPVPGSTVPPAADPASVVVPAGLEVLLVVPDAPDAATTVLADAVDRWAAAHGVAVDRHDVAPDDDLQPLVAPYAQGGHDVVVVAPGGGLVDPLDALSSQNLAVPFLLLGAQLPEPTANVTAVVWPGATSRGSRAPADEDPDATTVTPERSDAAVAAGAAQVLAEATGTVVELG